MPFPLAIPAGISAGAALYGALKSNKNTPKASPLQGDLEDFFGPLLQGPQVSQGFSTLSDILGAQGQTDPQLFNQQLANIARGTQQQQQNTRGQLAGLGPGVLQSGMGQAILGAIGNAGQDRLAGARANEAQLAEQRKRSDLGLLLQMIFGPAMSSAGLGNQAALGGAQLGAQQQGAFIGGLGSLLGNLGALQNQQTQKPVIPPSPYPTSY